MSSILLVSDTHHPYEHPDTVPFLRAIKKKYKPTRVICVGDEVDQHAMSFHTSDPDLPSAGDELELAIRALKPLYKMFPVVDLVDSNHGSMVYRKGKHHGIARKYLREYGDILEAPPGWKWHNNLLVGLPRGQQMYVTHGVRKEGMKLAQQMGCCVVQGHYHTEFNINYSSSPSQLYWSMQIGCCIDDKSLAFHYNKTTAIRPIIGHGIVLDGIPKLLPMLLDEDGKWIGVVP
jgi:predicted phosphodiesterase